jgi:hypothetical protein
MFIRSAHVRLPRYRPESIYTVPIRSLGEIDWEELRKNPSSFTETSASRLSSEDSGCSESNLASRDSDTLTSNTCVAASQVDDYEKFAKKEDTYRWSVEVYGEGILINWLLLVTSSQHKTFMAKLEAFSNYLEGKREGQAISIEICAKQCTEIAQSNIELFPTGKANPFSIDGKLAASFLEVDDAVCKYLEPHAKISSRIVNRIVQTVEV